MCILTKLFRNVYPHQIILKRVSEILLVNMSMFASSIGTLLFLFIVVYKNAGFFVSVQFHFVTLLNSF